MHFLYFDDLPAGGSSKVGERDRKLTRVGGRGAVYIYSNRGDSSTRQMGERSNRAGEGVPPSSRFKVKVLFGY